MTTRSACWGRLAAFLLAIGIILSPLRAMAATIPDLTASASETACTATMRLGASAPLTGHAEGTRTIAYDEVLVRYDDSTNLPVIEASRAIVGEPRDYDRGAEHVDWRPRRREGAICGAADTGLAARVPPSGVRILAQQGDEVILAADVAAGEARAIATMTKEGETLFLRGAHIEGDGTWKEIARIIQRFGREQGVKRVVIEGGKRTTGANPGHLPRPITIEVPW